jgi:hypothetical protein
MDKMPVNSPKDLTWAPFNGEAMSRFGSIKPEIDIVWGTSIAEVEVCSFTTWVIEDVDHKPIWPISRDLDIYLLTR